MCVPLLHDPVELDDVIADLDTSQSPTSTNTSESPTSTDTSQFLTSNEDDVDESLFDDHEEQLVERRRCEQFVEKTCGCSKADGMPRSDLFSVQHFTDLCAQASLLYSVTSS